LFKIDEREDMADDNPDMQDKNTDKVIGTEHDTTDVQQIETAEGIAGTSDQPDDKQVRIVVLLCMFDY
jgi:hypothetical protein